MKNNHVGRKLAVGAIVAGVAGYVAGVLTAPKSGKETRADLANKAGEFKEDALAKLKKAHDELGELLEEAKTKTLALSAKAREEFNEAVVKAKDSKAKLATVMKAVKAGESDEPELNKALNQAKLSYKNLAKYLKA